MSTPDKDKGSLPLDVAFISLIFKLLQVENFSPNVSFWFIFVYQINYRLVLFVSYDVLIRCFGFVLAFVVFLST